MFKFIEAKEAGKCSAITLTYSQGAATTHRYYKRNKMQISVIPPKRESNINTNSPGECSRCGRKDHGKKVPPYLRKTMCPALNQTCRRYNKLHNFTVMCRSTTSGSNVAAVDEEENIFQILCSIPSTTSEDTGQSQGTSSYLISNVSQDSKKATSRQASRAQLVIKLSVCAMEADYRDLGFPLKATTQSMNLPVMADTGCQCCLASIAMIRFLGLHKKYLIPVSMRMHAANNEDINILGAAILRFAGTDRQGKPIEARQVVYITDDSDRIFLSREACVVLGMITNNFPTVEEVMSSTLSQIALIHKRITTMFLPTPSVTATTARHNSLSAHT